MIYLPVSGKRWMSTKFINLELSQKLFTWRRMENITKFHRPDYLMVWRCHGIPYFNFYKCYSASYLIAAILSVLFQELKIINNIVLKDTLQLKILQIWINIRTNSFIKTWVNILEQKSISPHFKEHCNRIEGRI